VPGPGAPRGPGPKSARLFKLQRAQRDLGVWRGRWWNNSRGFARARGPRGHRLLFLFLPFFPSFSRGLPRLVPHDSLHKPTLEVASRESEEESPEMSSPRDRCATRSISPLALSPRSRCLFFLLLFHSPSLNSPALVASLPTRLAAGDGRWTECKRERERERTFFGGSGHRSLPGRQTAASSLYTRDHT
jgi:hypothetical protein